MKNVSSYFDFLKITLASPYNIKKKGILSLKGITIFGNILTEEFIEPKTLSPTKQGLFSEQIFGSISLFNKNTNKKLIALSQKFRRYKMGFIQLSTSVTHL
jgi:DNA-directed RNA polymerase beta' subunit